MSWRATQDPILVCGCQKGHIQSGGDVDGYDVDVRAVKGQGASKSYEGSDEREREQSNDELTQGEHNFDACNRKDTMCGAKRIYTTAAVKPPVCAFEALYARRLAPEGLVGSTADCCSTRGRGRHAGGTQEQGKGLGGGLRTTKGGRFSMLLEGAPLKTLERA